ncbi:N-acetylmuramoyl-L-alanine amidase [Actinacidiphila acididurans]|uniref:N-acetylmuramoyl-L-alanine amidase n=1 Tax=Actinacidiphila acididurans TaxID=2784346 RepID=A0ABS2U584_9ACTN|nr:peptidoglycan recognition family protein [Actinacidiphila acididurans]MBM9510522.1 N-acetylmuramoyl-L-alanine amidase [Actinacidiphila acididurans]
MEVAVQGTAPPSDRPRGRRTLRTLTAATAAAALLPVLGTAHAAEPAAPQAGPLQQAFADAAAHYQVPRSVLLAVSYMESRWDTHQGLPSVTGGYGPMHLTDARTALADFPQQAMGDGGDDGRGDDSRPLITRTTAQAPDVAALPANLTTVDKAATLTGLSDQALREDPAANVAGGAALLADAQRGLGEPLGSDPADWYAAVARYSGADDAQTAASFADDVFDVLAGGQSRLTDTGEQVTLAADPGLKPAAGQSARIGLRKTNDAGTECPPGLGCEWVPAPYQDLGGGDYGNYDLANRPVDEKIDTIVIHDTEGYWDTAMQLVQDPTYLAWHYTVRSSDGHVAQHVLTKNVGWHAGNWYVNAKSIGIEHEGFLVDPGTWYTEAMYRSSARLVRYLAAKYDIPLDRQHILGHDNVPGPTASYISGMHTDPGPYWDWGHYMELLGAPVHPTAGPWGGAVTIDPQYETNQPLYTGCVKAGTPCPAHGSDAVRLYTAPSFDAPLVKDIGLHGATGASTTDVNDVGARASTGQQFAVADRQGDWTAIWYLGQEAWFWNPAAAPTAVNALALVATPKPGLASIPVYGRAYPEASAYPAGVPVQGLYAMPYQVLAGQRYVVGGAVHGEYYYAVTYDPSTSHTVVRGKQLYYEVQLGHRVEWVRADDVDLRLSPVGASH